MQLDKHDVERIAEQVIRALELHLEKPDFTDPNTRTIQLRLNGRTIDQVSFSVVQKREYEG